MASERSHVLRLHDSAEAIGFSLHPPLAGDSRGEDAWMECACCRDEYESARARRLRSDNPFFATCPRCHFDLQSARRELESLRAELPWYRSEAARPAIAQRTAS